MRGTFPDDAIRRIASTQREAFWTKREREKTKIVEVLMAGGYGDWIASFWADQYLDGEEVEPIALELIEASEKVAGVWQDAWRVIRPRMDTQPWMEELGAKLEAIGMSLHDFENSDLIWWHEEGYSPDEAVQLAMQFG